MGQGTLNTETSTYNRLINPNIVYRVPTFQRDYSWQNEEWEDLWNDIEEIGADDKHFMGYLVLQTVGRDSYLIIDGQQRFTTLSIISLAVIKCLQDLVDSDIEIENNIERINTLQNLYIGFKDPGSLIAQTKLYLNKNNDDLYQSILIRGRKPFSLGKLKPSEKLLWKSFQYFYEKIKTNYGSSGSALADYLNKKIATGLIFTVIVVDNDLNAYKVFETLNARGVKLSSADLLKNFIFSIVSKGGDSDLSEAERQWQSIIGQLASKEIPTFLRHYWNSFNSFIRQGSLYKEIKKTISTPQEAFSLLSELEQSASIYNALSSPADPLWSPQEREHIAELDIFDVSQCYPLLMVAHKKIPTEFLTILRAVSIISFRYNVIARLNPNELEVAYNRAAIAINNGKAITSRQVLEILQPVYINDAKFKLDFETKTLDTNRYKKLVRYIMFKLEKQISGKSIDPTDITITLEHILPENPSEGWAEEFDTNEHVLNIYRLGNIALLEEKLNSRIAANAIFGSKKAAYAKSGFMLTSDLLKYENWNPEAVQSRQSRLSDIAKGIWRISQFD